MHFKLFTLRLKLLTKADLFVKLCGSRCGSNTSGSGVSFCHHSSNSLRTQWHVIWTRIFLVAFNVWLKIAFPNLPLLPQLWLPRYPGNQLKEGESNRAAKWRPFGFGLCEWTQWASAGGSYRIVQFTYYTLHTCALLHQHYRQQGIPLG